MSGERVFRGLDWAVDAPQRPICRNCKHWGLKGLSPWFGCLPCQGIDSSPTPESSCFVGGGDDNDSLYTGPEFGCTLFSPKEPT